VTFDVDTGRRRRLVEIARNSVGFRAGVDGAVCDVDAVRVDGGWSLLIAPVDSGSRCRRSREVRISAESGGRLLVRVDGRLVRVTVERTDRIEWKRRSASGPSADGPGHGGPHRVVSPMPGRVVKVLAAAGETVAARQGLVVVEAMKMENELRAPRAGVVTDVRVREGSLVEANTVLMVLE
jgi:biotin carboxyl carrier protein